MGFEYIWILRTGPVKTFLIVAGSVLAGIVIFVAIVSFVIWKSSPNTPEHTAHILIYDKFMPGRALSEAIAYGDQILPQLRHESENFKQLDSRNSEFVAQVLANNPSQASLQLSRELYEREALYAKLVGAVGLAAHGHYPEPITPSSFLVRVALDKYPDYRNKPSDPVGSNSAQELMGYDVLAILALGYSKNPKALPFLIEALNGENQWSARIGATYVSLGRLEDKRAIPIIEKKMRERKSYTSAEALFAMLKLGYKKAMPLAFPDLRVPPQYWDISGKVDIGLRMFLEEITSKNYGGNVEAWQRWWKNNGAQWEIPKDLTCTPCFPYVVGAS